MPEGGRKAAAHVPLPPLLPPPRRNFDGDKVPFSNHTHAKVWLIKRHFCKTTQTSVTVCVSKYQIVAFIECSRAKSVSASGGFAPVSPRDCLTRGSAPRSCYIFLLHTTTEYNDGRLAHTKIIAPVPWPLPLPPSYRFLAPPMLFSRWKFPTHKFSTLRTSLHLSRKAGDWLNSWYWPDQAWCSWRNSRSNGCRLFSQLLASEFSFCPPPCRTLCPDSRVLTSRPATARSAS